MNAQGLTYRCQCGGRHPLLANGPAVTCECGVIVRATTQRPVRFPQVGTDWVVEMTAPARQPYGIDGPPRA